MAEIINLKRFRKARAKAEEARTAEENRIRFGRTKAEKSLAESTRQQDDARLEGHRRDTPYPGAEEPGET